MVNKANYKRFFSLYFDILFIFFTSILNGLDDFPNISI